MTDISDPYEPELAPFQEPQQTGDDDTVEIGRAHV